MKIHNLIQGTDEWAKFRLDHFGASEAAAMLGISSKVKRTELLHMKFTSQPKEFSVWVQEHILDYGHAVEALARPFGEELIGAELYPVTCSDGKLSASCDGLTLLEDCGWEHKQYNAQLAAAVVANELSDEFMVQPQQCLMVTGADRWIFSVSDGTKEGMVSMTIRPDPAWFERIRAGWEQFAKDLAEYVPLVHAEKPQAEAIMQLPAVVINVTGSLSLSNLDDVTPKFDAYLASVRTDLQTDEHFVNAKETAKFSREAAKTLKLKADEVIGQISSVSEAISILELYAKRFDALGLAQEKLVEKEESARKLEIMTAAKEKFSAHIKALEAEITPIVLGLPFPDFAGAMKNKRTMASLRDSVDTCLANAKIAADALALAVRTNLAYLREYAADHLFLFSDQQNIIFKAADDFKMLVNSRVTEHNRAEEEKRTKAAAVVQTQVQPQTSAPVATSHAPATVTTISTRKPVTSSAPPSLRLGQIGERLGFALTADFLKNLGFEPAGKDKSAILFHESTFGEICAALVKHIAQVQAKQAA